MLKSDHSVPNDLFEQGVLIVQYLPHASAQDCMNTHLLLGTSLIQQIPELNTDVIAVPPGSEMEYLKKYSSYDHVCNVELNYYVRPDFIPNDPFYYRKTPTSKGWQSQWGLRKINPLTAWDVTRRHPRTIKIAIIDTGIDPNHPDLAGIIVDPINFTSSDPNDYIDRFGHGTWTAGIAAAISNNRTGIAGTSLNTAFIMPIKVLNGTIAALLNAIIYAIQKGAKVINMSLGFPYFSNALQSVLNLAWNNGIVIVASAGNDCREQVQYPAGYNYVLTVSATDQSNCLANFSSWGVDVGVAAPGTAILSTTPTYPVTGFSCLNYDASDGTSASTPFVSGVAAMLFAVCPHLTNQEVIHIIEQTARPLSENQPAYNVKKAWNPFFGYGLLDAGKALRQIRRYHCHKHLQGLGSFYGQLVDRQTGLPIGDAIISARRNGETKKSYQTKTNVPVDSSMGTDGMFRLMNLGRGTYDIWVTIPPFGDHQVQTATIEPGADTFLRLVV